MIIPAGVPIPEQIKKVIDKEKVSLKIGSYEALKRYLNAE